MAHTEQRTIDLPSDQAGYIDAQISCGLYSSSSEVVQAGLRALQEHDSSVEHWLHEQVAPVVDAMRADPSLGIPAEEVFSNLRAYHAARLKDERAV